MSFGFGISDFIQVSNLAFQLYRKCRECSKEFADVSNEVASLRLVVDDIRMTIKENSIDENTTEAVLQLGQGCLDCLLELESLLRKYQNLGTRSRTAWDRVRWDKEKISAIRQRVISNTTLLASFNISLTRSSTARIESLLRGLVEDMKAGRHEGSVISIDTMRSIQDGNEDIWKDVMQELEVAGITEEELNENKDFITQWIIKTIQSARVEQGSLASVSFHTAAEGTGSLLSGHTLTGDLPSIYDFPGTEYRSTKDLAHGVETVYKDAPEEFCMIKNRIREFLQTCREVEYSAGDKGSLYYHERLARKDRMIPVLSRASQSLRQLQLLDESFQISSTGGSIPGWRADVPEFEEARKACNDLGEDTAALHTLFKDLGTLALCGLDDRIKLLLGETTDKQRSNSILYEWDELAVELADGQSVSPEDVENHKKAILSFLSSLVEEKKAEERVYHTVSHSDSTLEEFSKAHSDSKSLPPNSLPFRSEGSVSEVGRSVPSLPGSSPSDTGWKGSAIPVKPKRISLLFVDWDNTVRSPMAQAYLEHLMAVHPQLAGHFSRVLSAGLSASKPGVPLPPGVDFMLRDYGIARDFQRTFGTSRRLEKRDVEKFEFVLAMNSAHVTDILSHWELSPRSGEHYNATLPPELLSENGVKNVRLLGSFGNQGQREVAIPEAINGHHWFQVKTQRIYPGFDSAFNDIKRFIIDLVLDLTGYDINSQAARSGDEGDSRVASQDISEDEDYSNVLRNAMRNPWASDSEDDPFEELSKAVSHFQGGRTNTSDASDGNPRFTGPESPLLVMIRAEQQQSHETDEELMHKHHEQFEKLLTLLSTDVGDNSPQSLRHVVQEWEDDGTRAFLTVNTMRVRWVLQKNPTETSEGCALCLAQGKKYGLVLDHNLEVISTADADRIANYLTYAIQQSNQQTNLENTSQLEYIRDHPVSGPAAPRSIRDDVSVSVWNDKPNLAHDIAQIRKKDAERKMTIARVNSFTSAAVAAVNRPERKTLPRRKTDNGNFEVQVDPVRTPPRPREASDATITPSNLLNKVTSGLSERKASPEKKPIPSSSSKPQVSILFLSATHMHLAVMAEVYLLSLVDKNLALAYRVCDIVSAGVSKSTPEQRFNPKKLERLFKKQDIFSCWAQKPERLLLPEDVVDFNYIFTIDNASHQAPYLCWAEENPDEHAELQAKAKGDDQLYRNNFKSKIQDLSSFNPEKNMGKALVDPVQPGEKNMLGVRQVKFEEAYQDVKSAIDRFLLLALKFNVETMRFVKGGRNLRGD